MIAEHELQTQTQHAIARVSLAQRVAKAVVEETAGEYMRGSELYHFQNIRKLVKDAGHLSVVLSDAYSQGLVGRQFSPMGKERYAYGAPGKTAGEPSRRVIKGHTKQVSGYGIFITKGTAEEVLEMLETHPGAVFAKTLDGYTVSFKFSDKGQVLDFLVDNDMLAGVQLVEVR